MKEHILVLGADGLVGQTVFSHLNALSTESVWGTVRNKRYISANVFPFSVSQCKRDFETIYKKLNHIEYIINCIGVTDESSKKLLKEVNEKFPHILEELTKKTNTKLLHISTDAVFPPLRGKVTEQNSPEPVTDYGRSKLAGETSAVNTITIRTSFLGIDGFHKRGFLEKVLLTDVIDFAYINQTWSGCTTYQFAQFCTQMIKQNNFEKLRSLSEVFHFTPLHVESKYQLIQAIVKVYNKKKYILKKVQGMPITRSLTTNFFDELEMYLYTQQIIPALKQTHQSV